MNQIYGLLFSSLVCITLNAQPNFVELSHYVFPEFTQGTILMKSGNRNQALLNYNSLTEEMIFDNKGKKLAIGKHEMRLVDTIYIKNRKFVALNGKFMELIYHSQWDLFVEHKCKVEEPGKPAAYGGTSHTSASTSLSTYMDGSMVYDLKLPDGFETKPFICYWLKKTGDLNQFVNMRELKKMYKNQKDDFKKYIKANKVKYDNQDSIIQLIENMESKKI